MFETIAPAPPDAIFGLTEAFKKDTHPQKINLAVGVFKDASGQTPVMRSVRLAEERIYDNEKSKTYLAIDGLPAYNAATQRLVFGDDHEIVTSQRAATIQAPGGTGALRLAAEFLAKVTPNATVWVSDPTWPNHPSIFQAASLSTRTYPYFDSEAHQVDFDNLLATFNRMEAGDAVILHGCCHNPTGADLSIEQWQEIGAVLAQRGVLPIIDFAYQGFAKGLREDAEGLLTLCTPGCELLVASSFSKNFGLYNERTGALTVVTPTAQAAAAALSHVKQAARANFSNPPAHGATIVATVLDDPALHSQWTTEVAEIRDRINAMRHLFVETLNEKGVVGDFSYITQQRGMFSLSGLTRAHVDALREQYSIYIVGSSRVNVAGMTDANIDYLCSAIADVVSK